LAKLAYEETLRKLDLPTVAFGRIIDDTIEVFKYMNGIYKVECFIIVPLHETIRMVTREHGFQLAKRESHSQLRANVFSNCG
jgi:hypothetical protein